MKRARIAYRVTVALFVASAMGITAIHLLSGRPQLAPLGPACLVFLLIPPVGERLLRLRLGTPLKTVIIAFCLLGFNFGTALRWCDEVPHYDDFLHLLSGVLFTGIGLCLYARTADGGAVDRGGNRLQQLTYAFFFSMFVAVIWEIGEFTSFLITGHDAQHTLTTGVFDTMEDMIACFIGSLLAAADCLLGWRRGRTALLGRLVAAFDTANAIDKTRTGADVQ